MRKALPFLVACVGVFLLVLSYHVGATTAGAQSAAQEVATLSGVVGDGGTIPLPIYADGTMASEFECTWVVNINALTQPSQVGAINVRCFTTGRTVSVYWDVQCSGCGGQIVGAGEHRFPGTANFLIIAVRGSGPTAAQRVSIGQLKAKYAPPAGKAHLGNSDR